MSVFVLDKIDDDPKNDDDDVEHENEEWVAPSSLDRPRR